MSVSASLGRSFVLMLALVLAFVVSAPPTQAYNGYRFIGTDGTYVLSDVSLSTSYSDSVLTIDLDFTPSGSEITTLQGDGAYVDFEFTTLYFNAFGESPDYWRAYPSGYAANIDSVISIETEATTIRMVGFPLDRWIPGREMSITVEIDGYYFGDGETPLVMVDLMSTDWEVHDGRCHIMIGVSDRHGNEMCAYYGPRARLTDWHGGTRF